MASWGSSSQIWTRLSLSSWTVGVAAWRLWIDRNRKFQMCFIDLTSVVNIGKITIPGFVHTLVYVLVTLVVAVILVRW